MAYITTFSTTESNDSNLYWNTETEALRYMASSLGFSVEEKKEKKLKDTADNFNRECLKEL